MAASHGIAPSNLVDDLPSPDDLLRRLAPLPGSLSEQLLSYRRIVVLTEGESASGKAKTAINLLRYRTADMLAVLDSVHSGRTAGELFGVGGEIPIIASLEEAPGADALFIGIAPAGGKLPASWQALLEDALARGMDVVSGLHDFMIDNAQLRRLAVVNNRQLVDLRRNGERSVANYATFPRTNLRIHTVGQDCSVGKMVAAVEIERGLQARGHDARFLATGQTGIMISGDGAPVDAVVADFVSGAVENLVLRHARHDTLIIEGQGCLAHPSFSGVTLSLLHGCAPHGLVMCYDAGRTTVKDLDHVPLTPLPALVKLYETAANLRHPCKVIAVAANTRRLDDAAAAKELRRVEAELGLPACDVYRNGPDKLLDAVLQLRTEVIS